MDRSNLLGPGLISSNSEDDHTKMLGYKQYSSDHTLSFKHFQTGGVTILKMYVDDIIITGDNDKEAMELEEQLIAYFEVKRRGTLKYFLGIEIAHSSSGYLMT